MVARHKNNFDFLRFVFALFVLVSHSFALGGKAAKESLFLWTNGQASFSNIGLAGFFVISGYFIFKSLERSSSVWDYLKKRCLRVFPALFVVLFLTILLIPLLYVGDNSIWSTVSYWTYLPNNLSLYGFQATVDGVFTHLPYHSINGSLWTIKYEFSLYIALISLFFIQNRPTLKLILTGVLLLLFLLSFKMNFFQIHDRQLLGFHGYSVLNLGTYFIAGVLLAQLKLQNWRHDILIWITLVLLFIAFYMGVFNYVKHILIPVFILSLGFYPIKIIQRFSDYGDASYGIYIYSFPTQQLIVYYFSPDVISLLLYSLLLSILFGYISWHLIEKKALELKRSKRHKKLVLQIRENSFKI